MVASLILLVMAPLFLFSLPLSAQQAATLRCRLGQVTVDVDSHVTLLIEVLNVTDLYGYELSLKFNAAHVYFEDADEGRPGVNLLLGDFLSPDFVVVNEANNSMGQADLALIQLSPSQAASGSGELARATVLGMHPGIVSFNFADVVLSDPAGAAIPVTLQNCSVEVTAGATPTPTPTPIPTLPGGDASVVVEPDAEATLVYTGTNGLPVTIQVPTGAVTETITLVYTEGTIPSTAPLNLQFAGVHFRLEAYRNNVKLEGYVFQIPIQFELRYTNADVAGLAKESILLYYFEKKQGVWSTGGIEVLERDMAGNRLRVGVAHLTEFATFTPPSSTVDAGSISGIVFEDLNRNGIHDLGEPGVRALIKLYLLDSERVWSTLSSSDGSYLFRRLPDGAYFVEITPLVNVAYAFTTSATVDVALADGAGVAGIDFGLDFGATWLIFLPSMANSQPVTGIGELSTRIYLPTLTSIVEAARD